MAKLLDLIRAANGARNKQQHRLSSNTKRGRQFLADKTKPLGTQTSRETNAREAISILNERTASVISEGNIRQDK